MLDTVLFCVSKGCFKLMGMSGCKCASCSQPCAFTCQQGRCAGIIVLRIAKSMDLASAPFVCACGVESNSLYCCQCPYLFPCLLNSFVQCAHDLHFNFYRLQLERHACFDCSDQASQRHMPVVHVGCMCCKSPGPSSC